MEPREHKTSSTLPAEPEKESKPDQLLGLFADDAELMDDITESAMQARERDMLRVDAELAQHTGMIPAHINVEHEYTQTLEEKHQ